jgi:hypothetical protein
VTPSNFNTENTQTFGITAQNLVALALVSVQTPLRINISGFCEIQGGSNMTGTDLCVNKPHCAAAVRP